MSTPLGDFDATYDAVLNFPFDDSNGACHQAGAAGLIDIDKTFFPELPPGRPSAAALDAYMDAKSLAGLLCSLCDIRESCLADALGYEAGSSALTRFGTWGGTEPQERADLDQHLAPVIDLSAVRQAKRDRRAALAAEEIA